MKTILKALKPTAFYKTHNRIEVSKTKLLANYDYLAQISGLSVFPVLKSNAYGHGIAQVTEILKSRRFPYIAVDGYFEALRVRQVSQQPVLIMGAIDAQNLPRIKYQNFTFMVQDKETIKALGKLNKKVNIHLDIDTGMKRYGFEPEDLPSVLDLIDQHPKIELEGLCTHLADGDNPDSVFTIEQVKRFDTAAKLVLDRGFEPRWIHVSNTPGLLKVKSKYANSFRAGIGLYGINPLSKRDTGYSTLAKLKPALRLISTITLVRKLNEGESVSYNRTWKAKKPTLIGVLPLGYYEGVPRSLSNKGLVTHGKRKLKIVGRICMNHTMIDLTDTGLKVGDEVIVINDNPKDVNSIEGLTNDHYFFTYGLLAKLNSDVRRVIVE